MWLKLSDDHGDECARVGLSDAAFRTHVEALLWTMRRETGGRISGRDVKRFAESDDAANAVRELLDVGFWRVDADGWVLVQAMEHQPEPDVVAKRRELNADRQRKHRRKRAGLDDGNGVTGRVTRDGSGRVGTGSNYEGGTSGAREGVDGFRCMECGSPSRDLGFDLCSACVMTPESDPVK